MKLKRCFKEAWNHFVLMEDFRITVLGICLLTPITIPTAILAAILEFMFIRSPE